MNTFTNFLDQKLDDLRIGEGERKQITDFLECKVVEKLWRVLPNGIIGECMNLIAILFILSHNKVCDAVRILAECYESYNCAIAKWVFYCGQVQKTNDPFYGQFPPITLALPPNTTPEKVIVEFNKKCELVRDQSRLDIIRTRDNKPRAEEVVENALSQILHPVLTSLCTTVPVLTSLCTAVPAPALTPIQTAFTHVIKIGMTLKEERCDDGDSDNDGDDSDNDGDDVENEVRKQNLAKFIQACEEALCVMTP